MQGFGLGLIWGAALGVLGLGLASLMAPMPGDPQALMPPAAKPAEAVSVSSASEFARPRPDTAPILPQVEPSPIASAAPQPPVLDGETALPSPDSRPPLPPAPEAVQPTQPAALTVTQPVAPALPEAAPLAAGTAPASVARPLADPTPQQP